MPHATNSSTTGEMNGRSELAELKHKADKVTDASLEATGRIVKVGLECREIAIKTIVDLDSQGGQLDHIEESNDEIHSGMKEAQKHIKEMEKCCGLCICPWNMFSHRNTNEKPWAESDRGVVLTGQSMKVKSDFQGPPPPMSGYITRITNDAREDEMEANLREVGYIVRDLRDMATDISNEIAIQNDQIDRVKHKVDHNTASISDADKKVEKAMKR